MFYFYSFTILQQSPHWLQRDAPHLPPKLPLSFDITTPSNTPIPQSTPLTTPKGIQIQSAVLPQYTFWTNKHNVETERWDRRQVYSKSTHAVLYW